MLYRYSEVFRSLLVAADLALVAGTWMGAYWLRFHTVFPAPLGVPEFLPYAQALIVLLPLWLWLFRSHGLYEPQRTESMLKEGGSVIRATAIGVVLLVAISFFARSYYYSRGVVAAFSVLSVVSVIGLRFTVRFGLRRLRRSGYNLRYVLVVGGGRLAEEIIERIHAHPEAGLKVRGVFAEGAGQTGRRLRGVPILGGYGALKSALASESERVDQVILALPREEASRLEKVLADLESEVVSVKLVPDLLDVFTLCSSVESLDGLPIINLRESPMLGWAAIQKRAFDLVASSLALVVSLPLLGVIAAAIRVTSGSPVFYSQRRIGLDGRVFRMHKFRTMRPDAEAESGPVWARSGDPRRTRIGAFLRRTSLDELPQLWNVLRGEMSLVGPRPERPFFIEEFRGQIPGYMLRHKVKSGMTGWAQVHGWRGDTSLHERIEHDIYYIQNWSLALDLQILLMTFWPGSVHDNAY